MQPAAERERQLMFHAREFRGSRFRCLLATSLPRSEFAEWMNSLIRPFAEVSEKELYMPQGFLQPDEARLDEDNGFLTPEQVENVVTWWLAVRQNANTPNWDIVSKCTIGAYPGLILVEAKAHAGELNPHDFCGAGNELNRQRIVEAIKDASAALGQGWSLTADGRYQLSNRFAWAWKIASLGVPVVLIYLGFLDADEMGHPFEDHAAWERCLLQYADSYVPRSVWNSGVMVNGTPLIPLIRSANANVRVT